MLVKNKAIPLYYQVYWALKEMIEQGIFKPGDCVPSEQELEDRFKVSRITIRRAVDELVQEGILVKKRGLGTFVIEKKYTQQLNYVSSWAETMRDMQMQISTKQLKISAVDPPAFVAKALQLGDNDRVLKIWRLRYADGEPMCIMTNYIRSSLVPGMLEEGFGSEESLYAVLESRYNIKIARADEFLEARQANKREAELLRIPAGSALLCIRRVTYDDSDIPFELVTAASRGDKYQYSVVLHGRPERTMARF